MPSPFPGMDPYLEGPEWEDFHTRFNVALSETLVPAVRPRYVVRVERRVYVEHGLESDDQVRWGDVSVLWTGAAAPATGAAGLTTRSSNAPVECLLPGPQERRETYLVIREVRSLELVTVIETLSPTNKRASSDGRAQYLAKREEILGSRTNLVEIDLLRGGKPVIGLPAGDYFAVVSRGNRRPRTHVYPWTIREELPQIPIPLMPGEPEAIVDLQQVFTTVFDRADYQLSLNYAAALRPPLSPEDAVWRDKLAK